MWVSRVALCFLSSVFLVNSVSGLGHIAIRLLEYNHSFPGKLFSGRCCDGVTGNDCTKAICDPYFQIQVTEKNHQTQNINLKYSTGTLNDAESVNFSNTIGSSPNLVNNSIPLWPGTVEIRIDVHDNNTGVGSSSTNGIIANASLLLSRTKDLLLNNDTQFIPLVFQTPEFTLKAAVNVRCDTFYTYDSFCTKFCQPVDNATHHVACSSNGSKHCSPGWSGSVASGCPTIQSCTPTTCLNGGRCSSQNGVTKCFCPPAVTGRLCEHVLTTTPGVTGAATSGHASGTSSGAKLTASVAGSATTTTVTPTASPVNSGTGRVTSNAPSRHGSSPRDNDSGTSRPTTTASGVAKVTNGGPDSAKHVGGGRKSDDNDDTGAIVGGVVGGLGALALLSLLLFFLWRRRKREKEKIAPTEDDTEGAEQGEQTEKAPQKPDEVVSHEN